MRRTGVRQIIFILGITIVASMGCEKDCVQGAIKDCLCPSKGESTATCDGNSGEWKECDCNCDPAVKDKRLCACPPVEGKVFIQECKASTSSDNIYMWHPCKCPEATTTTSQTTTTNTTNTTPKDTGDDDTGDDDTGDDDTGDDDTSDSESESDTGKEITDGGQSDSGA